MDRLKMTLAFLLLKMTFEPSDARVLLNPTGCPSCEEGYFLKSNCTINHLTKVGIQCVKCTDCSALAQETLVTCSKTADSVCRHKTTTTVPPTTTPTEAPKGTADLDPDMWIVLPVIVGSVILIVLLSLFLILLSCRLQHWNKHQGLNVL